VNPVKSVKQLEQEAIDAHRHGDLWVGFRPTLAQDVANVGGLRIPAQRVGAGAISLRKMRHLRPTGLGRSSARGWENPDNVRPVRPLHRIPSRELLRIQNPLAIPPDCWLLCQGCQSPAVGPGDNDDRRLWPVYTRNRS